MIHNIMRVTKSYRYTAGWRITTRKCNRVPENPGKPTHFPQTISTIVFRSYITPRQTIQLPDPLICFFPTKRGTLSRHRSAFLRPAKSSNNFINTQQRYKRAMFSLQFDNTPDVEFPVIHVMFYHVLSSNRKYINI